MKQAMKKRLAGMGAAFLAAAGLLGCGQKINPEEYKTTVAATYGEEEIYLAEPLFYTVQDQWYMEAVYGSQFPTLGDLWKTSDDMVRGIKEEAMARILQTRILRDHAQALGVELTDEDKEKVSVAVDNYFEGTDPHLIELSGVDRDFVTGIYTNNAIATKVYAEMVKDVDTNVPVLASRMSKISYIAIPKDQTEDTANSILERASAGEELEALAEEFSSKVETKNYGTEDASNIGVAAVTMKTGEYKLAQDESSYYILYCVTEQDEEATKNNEKSIIDERKSELFKTAYENLKATAKEFKIVDKVWKTVDFKKPAYIAPETEAAATATESLEDQGSEAEETSLEDSGSQESETEEASGVQ